MFLLGVLMGNVEVDRLAALYGASYVAKHKKWLDDNFGKINPYLLRMVTELVGDNEASEVVYHIQKAIKPIFPDEILSAQQGRTPLFNQTVSALSPWGPRIIVPLIGYEAVCWIVEPTWPNHFVEEIIVTILLRQNAKDSIEILNAIVETGPDKISRGVYGPHKRAFFRYRWTVVGVLSILAHYGGELGEWAKGRLANLPQAYQDDPRIIKALTKIFDLA